MTNRTRRQPEFLVPLRPEAGPLRGQVERALRDAARSGRLPAGSVGSPSTRILARDLGVSRGVIVDAYEQLIAEGFLVTQPAARTIVAPGVRPVSEVPVPLPRDAVRCDFRPAYPMSASFRVRAGAAPRAVRCVR